MLTNLLFILFDSDIESTIIGAFNEGTESITNVVKAVGTGIAGLATIIAGLGAVYLIVSAMVDHIFNKGQGNILAEKGKILILLVACAVACGFITAALLS